MLRKIFKILLALSFMVLIFDFSNDNGVESSNKSDGIIIKSIQIIFKHNLTTEEKNILQKRLVVPVRKTAHLLVYLILGILIMNVLVEFKPINKQIILSALLICFLYACSDEIHQLFINGRSGEIKDVLLDTIGSMIGIIIFSKIKRR